MSAFELCEQGLPSKRYQVRYYSNSSNKKYGFYILVGFSKRHLENTIPTTNIIKAEVCTCVYACISAIIN